MTAVYNSVRTVASCIQSVAQQDYQAVEYIVVDGLSNDGSAEIIDQHADSIDILIRENDDGMYDALNKGIKAATGEIVGFLHADDLLATPQILTCVANAFAAGSLDGVYGDLVYVDYDDTDRIVRYWRSGISSDHCSVLVGCPPTQPYTSGKKSTNDLVVFVWIWALAPITNCLSA